MSKTLPVTHDWSDTQWDWPLNHHDGVVKVINKPDHFEVALECHYFKPNEIKVSVLNHEVTVYGEHEERTDAHGRVVRSVLRSYHLPPDVDDNKIKTHLTPKGLLLITADKKK